VPTRAPALTHAPEPRSRARRCCLLLHCRGAHTHAPARAERAPTPRPTGVDAAQQRRPRHRAACSGRRPAVVSRRLAAHAAALCAHGAGDPSTAPAAKSHHKPRRPHRGPAPPPTYFTYKEDRGAPRRPTTRNAAQPSASPPLTPPPCSLVLVTTRSRGRSASLPPHPNQGPR
jgi:hypothetical protein